MASVKVYSVKSEFKEYKRKHRFYGLAETI